MLARRLPTATLRRSGLLLLAAALLCVGTHAASASTRVATDNPNAVSRGSADAVTVVSWIAPKTYQLDVQNTSGIGFIDEFTWSPPVGLTITAIKSTEGGKCSLVGADIQCKGKLQPPACTCQAGGDLTVIFTANGLEPTFANGYWTYYGVVGAQLQIQQMTPVPYHIPSTIPVSRDLPLCKKGQKSTKARPCTTV